MKKPLFSMKKEIMTRVLFLRNVVIVYCDKFLEETAVGRICKNCEKNNILKDNKIKEIHIKTPQPQNPNKLNKSQLKLSDNICRKCD
jgi:hypothetical protein